ncbi:MAG TPA: Ig-like domain-containing protein, partial [Gemmatimonadales bacterium]|nr:Ig-like domain-containing protein [Gemmatimonadales bacterium]
MTRLAAVAVLGVLLAGCADDGLLGPGDVAELALAPHTNWIEPGTDLTLAAVATDPTGAEVPNPPLAWRSSSPAVASVDQSGTVTGLAPGTTRIEASSGRVRSEVVVTVLPASSPVRSWS